MNELAKLIDMRRHQRFEASLLNQFREQVDFDAVFVQDLPGVFTFIKKRKQQVAALCNKRPKYGIGFVNFAQEVLGHAARVS